MNKASKIFLNIITPSSLGIACYTAVILIILADNQWAPYSRTLASIQASNFEGTFLYNPIIQFDNFFKLQIVNDISLYVFWLIVASVVFFLAKRVVANADDAAGGLAMRHYIWPPGADVNKPLKEFAERVFFHLSLIVIIVIYLAKVPPLIKRWMQSNNIQLSTSARSIEDVIFLAIFLFLFLHVLVVLLRLLLTRKRLIS
jgi:hypothetical protein